jgi:hypothetical protein
VQRGCLERHRSGELPGCASKEYFPGLFTNAGWPTKRFDPPGYGHAAVGVVVTVGSGPARGLVAAIGCWWDSKAHSAVCLLVEEGPGKPVVKHLDALAKIAVPKVI